MKLAIDVVLLPPDPIMNLVLEWNGELDRILPENITLGKFKCLPHISLVMGCIRADRLDQAVSVLKTVGTQHKKLQIRLPDIRTVKSDSGNRVITLDITLTPELTVLHHDIVRSFLPLLTEIADESAIDDVPPISPDAIKWINQYIPDQCFENFWPHITLGFGEAPRDFRPISFEGSRLAMCHLGNYCACSRILAETALTGLGHE